RCYTREAIAKRGDNLDISWLSDDESVSDLTDIDEIMTAIVGHLNSALLYIEAIADELADTVKLKD
ncbi:SAM-dependent methyltransferase, partial [Citrobacter freundii]